MDFSPHGGKAIPHGTASGPHGLNFARTDGKMAAQNELLPHGAEVDPHEPGLRLREGIFARTKSYSIAVIFTSTSIVRSSVPR